MCLHTLLLYPYAYNAVHLAAKQSLSTFKVFWYHLVHRNQVPDGLWIWHLPDTRRMNEPLGQVQDINISLFTTKVLFYF